MMKACSAILSYAQNREVPTAPYFDQEAARYEYLVSIIVVTKDGLPHLQTLIPALLTTTQGINYELIVVDNASNDDSLVFLEQFAKPLNLTVIRNSTNQSFSKANNRAVDQAKGKYLVFLNNDIEPLAGWLNYLLEVVESEAQIGSVGARLVYPYIQSPRLKNPFKRLPDKSCRIQHAGIAFVNEGSQFRPFNRGMACAFDAPQVTKKRTCAALTAACLLMPRSVFLKVGGFDEQYNYGGEDVDLGLKVLEAGYRNIYCPEAILFHHEFGTQSKEKKKNGALRRQANLAYFQSKWFHKIKHHYWREKLWGKSANFVDSPMMVLFVADSKSLIESRLSVLLSGLVKQYQWDVVFLDVESVEPLLKNKTSPRNFDVLLCAAPEFNLDIIPLSKRNAAPLKIAWLGAADKSWEDASSLGKYDVVFSTVMDEEVETPLSISCSPATVFLAEKENITKEKDALEKIFLDALQQMLLTPSIAIKVPAKSWEGAESWGDYHLAVLLKKQLEAIGHRVILQVVPEWDNEEGNACDVAIVLRGLSRYTVKPHQLNMMWNISHPDDVSIEEYDEYDRVFIASEYWAKEVSSLATTPVDVMLQCSDTERFKVPTDIERDESYHQLLFVGNSRQVYRKILQDLLPTSFELSIYGKGWNKVIPKPYLKYVKGEHLQNEGLYKYYGSADILLNDHWDDMRQKGFLSNRIFDALACGAFVISDRVICMGEVGDFVQCYDSPEELQQLIVSYLEYPEERNEKVAGAVEYVRNNHTYQARATQFSRMIKSIMADKNQSGL